MDIVKASSLELSAIREVLAKNGLIAEDHLDRVAFFFQQHANKITVTGGVELYGEEALLRSITVDVHQRGKKLGIGMVTFLEAYLKEKSVQQVYLLTETASDFFGKLGYSAVSRESAPKCIQQSQQFSSICPSSAVLMTKKLGA